MRSTPNHTPLPGATTLIILLAATLPAAYHNMRNTPHWTALRTDLPLDLEIYLDGGKRVLENTPLYQGYINEGLQLPFTYPPFAGWVFSLIAGNDYYATGLIWYALTALATLTVILLVFNTFNFQLTIKSTLVAGLITLATLTLEPVHANYFFGQINVFLMLLVSLDFLLPEGKRLPGIGTGLAAGLKLTPAIFGIIFLVQRRWWAAAGSAATFLITVLIGNYTVTDGAQYWTGTFKDSTRIGDHTHPAAQSIQSVLIRAYDNHSQLTWVLFVLAALTLLIIALVTLIPQHHTALAVGVTGITACLISPFTWTHHYVWIVIVLTAILCTVLQHGHQLVDKNPLNKLPGKIITTAGDQLAAIVALVTIAALSYPIVAGAYRPTPTYSVLVHNNPEHGHWYMWTFFFYVAGVAFVASTTWALRQTRNSMIKSDACITTSTSTPTLSGSSPEQKQSSEKPTRKSFKPEPTPCVQKWNSVTTRRPPAKESTGSMTETLTTRPLRTSEPESNTPATE